MFSCLFFNSSNRQLLSKALRARYLWRKCTLKKISMFSVGMIFFLFIKLQIMYLYTKLYQAYQVMSCLSFLPLGFGLCKAARERLAHYRSRLQSGCLLCLWPPEGGNTLVKLFQNRPRTLLDRELFSQKMCISHTKAGFRVKDRTSVW